MKSTTRDKIKQRAEELKMQACDNHSTEDFIKKATRQIKNEEKIEKRIKNKAEKLRLQSSEYHDFEYYVRLAEYQIKIEQDVINKHQLYDPRKWINSLDYRCLKVWATQLKKCSFLNILEQIAVLSILVGTTIFFIEAKPRHDDRIRELSKNLAEVTELDEPRKMLISSYLYALNYRHQSFAQLFNVRGFFNLVNNTLKGEKIYVIDRKIGECKKIREIGLLFPRWPLADLIDLHLPENMKFQGLVLCNARMPQAVLNKIKLPEVKLPGAYLFDAKLKESELISADLTGADLTSADLTGADLTSANLTDANFTVANLIGADLTSADLTKANLLGAKLNEIEVNNLTMPQLKLACNWDKASYIFRQTENEKWELDTQANQQYIEKIRQDKASDPQTPVDCSKWN